MNLLELLALESKALPGHGRMKEVPAHRQPIPP
jgi:hypothetical protein